MAIYAGHDAARIAYRKDGGFRKFVPPTLLDSDSLWMMCSTAILIIIEGQFQAFQRFSSSKLVLKAVESCFVALNYHENDSTSDFL